MAKISQKFRTVNFIVNSNSEQREGIEEGKEVIQEKKTLGKERK